MKISFLLSFPPNPRMNKRMRVLSEGNEISLIYWRRSDVYVWGNVNNAFNKKEIFIPANMGHPLKRIIPTIKFARRAIIELKIFNSDCIYVQGFDMLAIAVYYKKFFRKKASIVYEVADLHALQIQPQKNVVGKLFQKILAAFESYLCSKTEILVVTSRRYYDCYYSRFLPREKCVYMANAPEKKLFINFQKKTDGEFTVGFVGAAHFEKQIMLLADAAKTCGVKLRIAGSFLNTELWKYCEERGAICTGTYNYETDIISIYSQLDCVFSVYPTEDANVNLALPNKLYESIVCGLPIVVAKGTYLSEIVEKYQVGVSVDCNDINQYIEAFIKLKDDIAFYQKLAKNCNKIREECYVDVYNNKFRYEISKIKNN